MVKEKKKKNKFFEPVKEQLEVLLEYIKIIEKKNNENFAEEITYLMSLIMTIKQQCIIYLSNELKNQGNKNGRNFKF